MKVVYKNIKQQLDSVVYGYTREFIKEVQVTQLEYEELKKLCDIKSETKQRVLHKSYAGIPLVIVDERCDNDTKCNL